VRWTGPDGSRPRRTFEDLDAAIACRDDSIGLRGSPSRGQRSLAIAKASWVASSARSKSPGTLIRRATTRPRSSRNVGSGSG